MDHTASTGPTHQIVMKYVSVDIPVRITVEGIVLFVRSVKISLMDQERRNMKLTIEINMDGAAFKAGPGEEELSRILSKLAYFLANDVALPIPLRDINGNIVGEAAIVESVSCTDASSATFEKVWHTGEGDCLACEIAAKS